MNSFKGQEAWEYFIESVRLDLDQAKRKGAEEYSRCLRFLIFNSLSIDVLENLFPTSGMGQFAIVDSMKNQVRISPAYENEQPSGFHIDFIEKGESLRDQSGPVYTGKMAIEKLKELVARLSRG